MIKYFVDAWDKNKQVLEDYLKTNKQEEYCNAYERIFQKTLELVINSYKGETFKYSEENIKVIDYGDYQGTQIITFCQDVYQPTDDETYYTSVYYGSCSGCDTLQGIYNYNDEEVPSEEQLNDYMTLALHLIQNIKCFGESELASD